MQDQGIPRRRYKGQGVSDGDTRSVSSFICDWTVVIDMSQTMNHGNRGECLYTVGRIYIFCCHAPFVQK